MKYQYQLGPVTDHGEYLTIAVDDSKDSRDPQNWVISLIKKNKKSLPLQANNIDIRRDGGTTVITLDGKNDFQIIYIPSPVANDGYQSDEEPESPFIVQNDGKKIIMQESNDIILDKKPAIQNHKDNLNNKNKSLVEKEESNQEECTERTNLIIDQKQDSNIKKDDLRNKIFSKLNVLKQHSKDVAKPFFFSYLSANSEKSVAINNFTNQVELLLTGDITPKTSYVELRILKHSRELGLNRNKFTCFWKNETKTQTLVNEIFQDMETLKR